MNLKIKLILGFCIAFLAIQGCSLKQKSTLTQSQGENFKYEELFKEDGNLIPINSAQIQRQLGE